MEVNEDSDSEVMSVVADSESENDENLYINRLMCTDLSMGSFGNLTSFSGNSPQLSYKRLNGIHTDISISDKMCKREQRLFQVNEDLIKVAEDRTTGELRIQETNVMKEQPVWCVSGLPGGPACSLRNSPGTVPTHSQPVEPDPLAPAPIPTLSLSPQNIAAPLGQHSGLHVNSLTFSLPARAENGNTQHTSTRGEICDSGSAWETNTTGKVAVLTQHSQKEADCSPQATPDPKPGIVSSGASQSALVMKNQEAWLSDDMKGPSVRRSKRLKGGGELETSLYTVYARSASAQTPGSQVRHTATHSQSPTTVSRVCAHTDNKPGMELVCAEGFLSNTTVAKKHTRTSQRQSRNILKDPARENIGCAGHTGTRVTVKSRRRKNLSLSSVRRRNRFGESMLHRAAMEGQEQLVRDMLQVGACVNQADNAGWTPLHEAVAGGEQEVVVVLLGAGAEVNCAGDKGVTPLHDAVGLGNVQIARLLLRSGADPSQKNDCGKSALDMAVDTYFRRLLERYLPKAERAKGGINSSEIIDGRNRKLSMSKRLRKEDFQCVGGERRSGDADGIDVKPPVRMTRSSIRRSRSTEEHRNPDTKGRTLPCSMNCLGNADASDGSARASLEGSGDCTEALGKTATSPKAVEVLVGINHCVDGCENRMPCDPVACAEYDADEGSFSLLAPPLNGERRPSAQQYLFSMEAGTVQGHSSTASKMGQLTVEPLTAHSPDVLSLSNSCESRHTPPHVWEECGLNHNERESSLAEINTEIQSSHRTTDHTQFSIINEKRRGPEVGQQQYVFLDSTETSQTSGPDTFFPSYENGHQGKTLPDSTVASNLPIVENKSNLSEKNCDSRFTPKAPSSGRRSQGDKSPIIGCSLMTDGPARSPINNVQERPTEGNGLVQTSEQAAKRPGLKYEDMQPTMLCQSEAIHLSPCEFDVAADRPDVDKATEAECSGWDAGGRCRGKAGQSARNERVKSDRNHVPGDTPEAEVDETDSCDSDCTMIAGYNSLDGNDVGPSEALEKGSADTGLTVVSIGCPVTVEKQNQKSKAACRPNEEKNSKGPVSTFKNSARMFAAVDVSQESSMAGAGQKNEEQNEARFCGSKKHKTKARIKEDRTQDQSRQTDSQTLDQTSDNTPCPEPKKIVSTQNISKRNSRGESHLHIASRKGDLPLVKALIQAGINVNQADYAGWTALHEASASGHTAVVKELLLSGADVTSKGLDGVTALHDAVVSNQCQVVQLLLQHGSNPDDKTAHGKNARDLACHEDIIELLSTFHGPFVAPRHCPSMSTGGTFEFQTRMRRRRAGSCLCCTADNNRSSILVRKKSDGGSRHRCESITRMLEEVEKKQLEISTWKLAEPENKGKFTEAFSEIQTVLNDVLKKHKAENIDLTRKHRIASDSFRQGVLREQLTSLASRQKRLLDILHRQNDLKLQVTVEWSQPSTGQEKQQNTPPGASAGENKLIQEKTDTLHRASNGSSTATEQQSVTTGMCAVRSSRHSSWACDNSTHMSLATESLEQDSSDSTHISFGMNSLEQDCSDSTHISFGMNSLEQDCSDSTHISLPMESLEQDCSDSTLISLPMESLEKSCVDNAGKAGGGLGAPVCPDSAQQSFLLCLPSQRVVVSGKAEHRAEKEKVPDTCSREVGPQPSSPHSIDFQTASGSARNMALSHQRDTASNNISSISPIRQEFAEAEGNVGQHTMKLPCQLKSFFSGVLEVNDSTASQQRFASNQSTPGMLHKGIVTKASVCGFLKLRRIRLISNDEFIPSHILDRHWDRISLFEDWLIPDALASPNL